MGFAGFKSEKQFIMQEVRLQIFCGLFMILKLFKNQISFTCMYY